MPKHKVDELIETYISIRDKIREEEAKVNDMKARYKSHLKLIEDEVQIYLTEAGLDSFSAGIGTAFKTKKDTVGVTDWHEFLYFLVCSVLESYFDEFEVYIDKDKLDEVVKVSDIEAIAAQNPAIQMLNKVVNKTQVKAFLDEHKALPPGVRYDVENVIQIRRK